MSLPTLPTALHLARDRFGGDSRVTIRAREPHRLEIVLRTPENPVHTYYTLSLNRGEVAMLRGLLYEMACWERNCVAAGLLHEFGDPDVPPCRE